MRFPNSPSISLLLVTIILLVVKCSAQFNLTTLPACDQNCFGMAIQSQSGCQATNTTCLCASQMVSNSLVSCLESECSYSDLIAARNYALEYCPSFAPSTTMSANSSATSDSAAGGSTQALNKANSGLAPGSKIGIGVVVPVGVLLLIFGLIFFRHTRKQRAQETLPPPATSSSRSTNPRSRSRSRSHSRSQSQARTASVGGKRSSKSEMRMISTTTSGSKSLTPTTSLNQHGKVSGSSSHSRNTSSATGTNTALMSAAGASGLALVAGTGKRGVTFDAELEKTNSGSNSGVGSSNSSTTGSLGRVGSNTNSLAPSSYRSLSPIAEPSSVLQSKPSSSTRGPIPPPITVSVYNERKGTRLSDSPPYAQHQSEPLPPPSPATPLHYVYAANDVDAPRLMNENQDGRASGSRNSSRSGKKRGSNNGSVDTDGTAEAKKSESKKSKKKDPPPRWKQWKDRQEQLSPVASPTTSGPKLDSMYNAI